MQQILTYAFLVIYTVTILGIVLVIITDNRNPLKTLPWIIVLVLAPVLGLIFYFFFGQNLSKQRIISRRTRKRITLQLEEAEHTDGPDLPEAYRPLAALLTNLQEGDVLQLYINDEFFDKPSEANAYLTVTAPKLNIVYEDENILLVDKKPGVAVHPHDGAEYGRTLIDHIQAYL